MNGFVQIWSILGKISFCIPMSIYCSIFLSHGDSNVIKATHFTNLCLFLGLVTDGKQRWAWHSKTHLIWRLHYKQVSQTGEVFSLSGEFLANSSNHTAHKPSKHEAIKVIWEPQFLPGCYFCLESRFAFIILILPFTPRFLNLCIPPDPISLTLGLVDPQAKFLRSISVVSILYPHCQQEVQFLFRHAPLKTSHLFFLQLSYKARKWFFF